MKKIRITAFCVIIILFICGSVNSWSEDAEKATKQVVLTFKGASSAKNCSTSSFASMSKTDNKEFVLKAWTGDIIQVMGNRAKFHFILTNTDTTTFELKIDGAKYYLNNKLSAINLWMPDGADFLQSADEAELEDVVTLCIGDVTGDLIKKIASLKCKELLFDIRHYNMDALKPLLDQANPKGFVFSRQRKLASLNFLSKATNLTHLIAEGCANLKDISALEDLTNLNALDISGATSITDISPLENLSKLQYLRMTKCDSVEDLSPLKKLANLEHLTMNFCASISVLTPLENLVKLKSIKMNRCGKISDISSIGKLLELENLQLESCPAIQNISCLAANKKITFLTLAKCSQICDISSLANLSNLTSLQLTATAVKDVTPLHELKKLKFLELSKCTLLSSEMLEELRKKLPDCSIYPKK